MKILLVAADILIIELVRPSMISEEPHLLPPISIFTLTGNTFTVTDVT
jgi:hypothetical protein